MGICGDYMMAKCRFNVRDFTKKAYEAYFGMKLGDQDKPWAPHKVCKHCTETLRFWTQGKVNSTQGKVNGSLLKSRKSGKINRVVEAV